MHEVIVGLQDLATELQRAFDQIDHHERICISAPRRARLSSEDGRTRATIRLARGSYEKYFHTPEAAELAIRHCVESLALGMHS